MKKSVRFASFVWGFALSFVLTGCGIGDSFPSTSPKLFTSAEVTGKTIPEKALSIAKVVSEKHAGEGLLVVSDAQFSAGLTLMTDDGYEPIWYALAKEEPAPDVARNMRGLVFTIKVIKPRSAISGQDDLAEQAAVGDIFSLVAKTFFHANRPEFSFVEVEADNPLASAPGNPFSFLSVYVYHASAESLIAERNKGASANWLTFTVGDPDNPERGTRVTVAPGLISTFREPAESPSDSPTPAGAP